MESHGLVEENAGLGVMNGTIMKCNLCSNEADREVEWGLFTRSEAMNKAKMCKECSEKLWGQIRGTVGAGLMHYEVNGI